MNWTHFVFNAVLFVGTSTLLSALHANAAEVGPRLFNVREFGAVGDNATLDTTAIQKTIDACYEAGGGTVRVPAGRFVIGTVQLKSNVTLSLDHRPRRQRQSPQADPF